MGFYWWWRRRQGRNIFMWFIFWRRNGWTNHVPLLLQTTSFPKPKRGKQHLICPKTKALHSYGAHLMAGPFSIALWVEEGINKFFAFSDLTMRSQDDIIGPLTSCNQLEKCLNFGTLTCVIPTPADQAWQWTNSSYALEDGVYSSNTFLQSQANTE